MPKGGKQPGAGRPKGKKNASTLEKERVLAGLRQRIMRNVDRIYDSQLSIAQGQQFLYRINIAKNGTRSKAELVESEFIIRSYLDGELDNAKNAKGETEFYFITTKEPNNFAIDSMLNRAFGKPTDHIDVTSDGKAIKGNSIVLKDFSGTKANGK